MIAPLPVNQDSFDVELVHNEQPLSREQISAWAALLVHLVEIGEGESQEGQP